MTITAAPKQPLPTQRFTGRSRFRKRPSAQIGDTAKHLKAMRGALKAYRKADNQIDRLNALVPIRRLVREGGKLRHALRHEGFPIGYADQIHALCAEISAEEVTGRPCSHGYALPHDDATRKPTKVVIARQGAEQRLQATLLELADHLTYRRDHQRW